MSPSSKDSKIWRIPTEIYEQIMRNLDHRTLLTCMRVCTFFRYIIATTTSLQYIIELALAGQVDNPQCNLSAAARIDVLRKHQSAWGMLDWSREYSIPIGLGGLWELYGGVLGMSTTNGALVFHQLPSDLRSIEQKIWTVGPDFGIREMRDFTMDPAQDLLVLFETPDWSIVDPPSDYHLYLRSLTTGSAHPHAKIRSSLYFRSEIGMEMSRILQISGRLIMLLLTSMEGDSELLIWDWKTGELLSNIYGEILSASLLSDDWVLCTCTTDIGDHPALSVVNFRKEGTTRRNIDRLTNAISLLYPRFSPEVDLIEMALRCDPNPSWKCNPCPSSPFHQDSRNALFVVTFRIITHSFEKCLLHFITKDHLLSMTTAVSYFPARKLWAEWGVSGTRFLLPRHVVADVWVYNVYGTKFALDHGKARLPQILDFNQPMFRKSAGDNDMVPGLLDIIVSREITSYFEGLVVETPLLYRCRDFDLRDSVSTQGSVMCCEDNVVIVDERNNRFHIFVF